MMPGAFLGAGTTGLATGYGPAPWLANLLLAASCLAGGAMLASAYLGPRHEAALAGLRLQYAQEAAEAKARDVQRLQEAQMRADALTRRLQEASAARDAQQGEKNEAIKKTTAGRLCLGADAVRVLNGSAARSGQPVPGGASGAAPESAAAASDTDIASWAAGAQAAHEQCRERFDALIDFVTAGQ